MPLSDAQIMTTLDARLAHLDEPMARRIGPKALDGLLRDFVLAHPAECRNHDSTDIGRVPNALDLDAAGSAMVGDRFE